jgi:hypothetical protein
LLAKLDAEGADDLADRLRKCGLEMSLWCRGCGHRHVAHTKCNRKWCPSCAPKRGNERAARLRVAIAAMRWPLHITFTVPNVALEHAPRTLLRDLMRAFIKLRRTKLWRSNVKGGCAALEVTDKGNGLHPHLHAVVDARWIALHTPAPSGRETPEELRAKLAAAANELQHAWQHATGHHQHLQMWIRRCDAGAAQEIVKYALKSEDAVNCQGEIAPVLRMLDSIRTVSTWGTCRGLKIPDDDDHALTCPNGHRDWSTTPPPNADWETLPNKLKLAKILSGAVARFQ